MRQISSRATWCYKRGLPTVWFIWWGLFLIGPTLELGADWRVSIDATRHTPAHRSIKVSAGVSHVCQTVAESYRRLITGIPGESLAGDAAVSFARQSARDGV